MQKEKMRSGLNDREQGLPTEKKLYLLDNTGRFDLWMHGFMVGLVLVALIFLIALYSDGAFDPPKQSGQSSPSATGRP